MIAIFRHPGFTPPHSIMEQLSTDTLERVIYVSQEDLGFPKCFTIL